MNVRRISLLAAVLALSVLFAGQPARAQDSAEAVFKRLLDKYNSISALSAEFSQTMESAFADGAETFNGRLVLQGEKYRVETDNETLVVDGEALYVYRPAEKQVLINDLIEDEYSFSPTDFLTNYDDRFEVAGVATEQVEGLKYHVLRLRPKNRDAFYREATLWMRDRDALVTRLDVTDANETRMTFVLKNIDLNPRLDAGTFRFQTPAGVEVVDLRS